MSPAHIEYTACDMLEKWFLKVRNVVTCGFILTIVNNDIMLTSASFSFKFSNEIAFFGVCHSVKHSASLFAWLVGIFLFFKF